MSSSHTFHIPVMGTAFSIDSPIKVAKYGISSVISLVDDTLIEEMRKVYCEKMGEAYEPITKYDEDFRARRITEYLNLVDRIVKKQFEELKNSAFEIGSEITKYFEMLPEQSPLKLLYEKMCRTTDQEAKKELQESLRQQMKPGSIDVNIMTKLDRPVFDKSGQQLPIEFSDALAALRGYGKSTLESAIVFSAGINRRLYSYVEEFKDFYADATGKIKKKIVIKVSDYRSCITQGKFFAKKGIWISEYRIESGLNCGGHAFATDGFLMGPILEEIKQKKQELIDQLYSMCNKALELKDKIKLSNPLEVKITAQGGIGNASENQFLHDHYNIDGTGWGTPFLLCPEATNVDEPTLKKLADAKEKDLYLSDVSPLGVPFNNLRGSSADNERDARVEKGRPGSACPKGHLISNTEFTKIPICSASRQYQKLKIDSLLNQNLSEEDYKKALEKVVVKSCICNDLGEAVLINNKVPKNGKRFSAICPGPNMAYFSNISSLKEMADHIYGRINIRLASNRPNMFIKELQCYIDYLKNDIKKTINPDEKEISYFNEFKNNLLEGIEYYQKLFPKMIENSQEFGRKIITDLSILRGQLLAFVAQHQDIFNRQEDESSQTTSASV